MSRLLFRSYFTLKMNTENADKLRYRKTSCKGVNTSLEGTKVTTGARIKLLSTVLLEKFVAQITSSRDKSQAKNGLKFRTQ